MTAATGQRFTTEECFRDQKNDLYEGFQLVGVKLGTPERWDRLLWVFAWAYYELNVGGWARERAKKDRDRKAHTVDRRTHALWRTLSRTPGDFGRRIPSLNRLLYDLGCFRQPGPHGGTAPRFRDPAWPIASIAAFI